MKKNFKKVLNPFEVVIKLTFEINQIVMLK